MDDVARRRLAQLFPEVQQRYGACERKIAYATLEEAIFVRERRQARAGIALSYYRCAYGEHYHLSKQPPTPEQAAQLRAEFAEQHQGWQAELAAYPVRWEALMRQAEAVGRDIQRRGRRLVRVKPSLHIIAELTERYAQQRDDLIRLEDLLEQLLDLDLRYDLIMAWAEALLAHPDDFRAGMAAWQVRCEALQAAAEETRQARAADLRKGMVTLDADHANNIERARAHLTRQYLP